MGVETDPPGSLAPGLVIRALVPWLGFCVLGPLLLKPPLLGSVAGCFLQRRLDSGVTGALVPTSPHQQREETRVLLVEAWIALFSAAGTITNDI